MRTIRLFDLLRGFSTALDMVTPALAGHHARVAYLSLRMAEKLGYSRRRRSQLLTAAILHDIGTVPLKTETRDLVFEINEGPHSRAGWAFCKTAGLPEAIHTLVLHHHTPWSTARACGGDARLGNLIHLADRLDITLRAQKNTDFTAVAEHLSRQSGKFAPRYLEALRALAEDREFVEQASHAEAMLQHLGEIAPTECLGPRKLLKVCGLFSLIIDSKSPFTATHSSGVAYTARALLQRSGLASAEEYTTIFVAGLLHDIGKLAVPTEILEKPAALTPEEFAVIQRHAGVGLDLLGSVPGFACIRTWGGLHHERPDGSGYPLGLSGRQLPLPARIMAVADVFTALTEDRPYRKGMQIDDTLTVMRDMAGRSALDADVVRLLADDVARINRARLDGQRKAAENFQQLRALCRKPDETGPEGEASVHDGEPYGHRAF